MEEFLTVEKNENIIAKMQYPLPSLHQVWSSQHEMCCFILLRWGQNQTEQCSHVGQPWKASTCGLMKGKLWVPPCTHRVQNGAQASQGQCGSGRCPAGKGWPCEVTAAKRQGWSPGGHWCFSPGKEGAACRRQEGRWGGIKRKKALSRGHS